ncbi:MAG: hypothetical protein H6772_01590 [Pseudomonadales bacterium]|nr:hypothetical protein [Pseudomonadales bacterium]
MTNTSNELKNILNSAEFKKRSSYAADDALKFSFKWIGISLKAVIDFIKSMIQMTLGK